MWTRHKYAEQFEFNEDGIIRHIPGIYRLENGHATIPNNAIKKTYIENGIAYINYYYMDNPEPMKESVIDFIASHLIGLKPSYKYIARFKAKENLYTSDNLEWVLVDETTQDKSKSHLVDDDIREIRKLHKEGMSFRKIAAKYDVSHDTIIKIAKFKTWLHVN